MTSVQFQTIIPQLPFLTRFPYDSIIFPRVKPIFLPTHLQTWQTYIFITKIMFKILSYTLKELKLLIQFMFLSNLEKVT